METKKAIEAMRSVVETYDRVNEEKQKLKNKAESVLDTVKEMKVGTVIEIAVGIFLLISVCAGIAYICIKGCPCKKKKCKKEEELFDEFPENENEPEKQPEEKAEETEE